MSVSYFVRYDIAVPDLPAFLERAPVRVTGLMGMPPFAEDPEQSRPHFAALRELAYLQVPTLPERALTRGDLVERMLALGTSTPLPDARTRRAAVSDAQASHAAGPWLGA